MKWAKTLPRVSGQFWVRMKDDSHPWIGDVEGRDDTEDGWVWMDCSNRIYLTPNTRHECGDEMQNDSWLEWEWAGPIPLPEE